MKAPYWRSLPLPREFFFSLANENGVNMITHSTTEQTSKDTTTAVSSTTLNSAAKSEPLYLPKGALIAFRKKGGAPARIDEVVLYPDGRVSFGGPDVGKEMYAHVPRKMNDAQIARLRKLLDHVNFFRLELTPGGEPPSDGFAYEIVARTGNRINSVAVFDGSIPDTLNPLLQQLTALMPKG
jgi:hypothetical protein